VFSHHLTRSSKTEPYLHIASLSATVSLPSVKIVSKENGRSKPHTAESCIEQPALAIGNFVSLSGSPDMGRGVDEGIHSIPKQLLHAYLS